MPVTQTEAGLWIVYTAPDGALWWAKPYWNDRERVRKAEFVGLELPTIPVGVRTVTVGNIRVTFGGAYVDGESIYMQTDDEIIARFISQLIQTPASANPLTADTAYHIVDRANIPGDHLCGQVGVTGAIKCVFRNAWQWCDGCDIHPDGAVEVNMPKARGIHMDTIRKVRNEELVKEDITFMRAVEAGDTGTQATIATKKQTLRDLPATFDITTDVDTPEKLKAKWPAELPARE